MTPRNKHSDDLLHERHVADYKVGFRAAGEHLDFGATGETQADVEANFAASQVDKPARLLTLARLSLLIVKVDDLVLQVEDTVPQRFHGRLKPACDVLAQLDLGSLTNG